MRVSQAIQWIRRFRFPLPTRLNLGVCRATEWLLEDYPPRPRSPEEGGPMKISRVAVFTEVFLVFVAFCAIIMSVWYPVVEAAL